MDGKAMRPVLIGVATILLALGVVYRTAPLTITGISPQNLVDQTSTRRLDAAADNAAFPYTDLPKRLRRSYATARKIQQAVLEEWDYEHFPKSFDETFDISPASWEIMKLKLMYEILLGPYLTDGEHAKQGGEWIMSFTGSSVTAGHDDYYNQSYPSVFNSTFRPAMDALGLRFDVRNQAMGNNQCNPYDYCVETIAGDDIDFVSWEQSFNCGNHVFLAEAFLRSAMNVKNPNNPTSPKPVVMFTSSNTECWTYKDCENRGDDAPTQPLGGSRLNNKNGGTSIDYSRLDWKRRATKNKLWTTNDFFSYHNRDIDKRECMSQLYQGMGVQIYDSNNGRNKEEYMCKGPYGPYFCETQFAGVRWHPGVSQHKLRGHVQSVFHLEMLKHAIEHIALHIPSFTYEAPPPPSPWGNKVDCEAESQKHTGSLAVGCEDFIDAKTKDGLKALMTHVQTKLTELQSGFPEKGRTCDDCDANVKCYTTHAPRMKNGLDEIAFKPAAGANAEKKGWGPDGQYVWPIALPDEVKRYVDEQEAACKTGGYKCTGYMDRKWGFTNDGSVSTPLVLLAKPTIDDGNLLLCEYLGGMGHTYDPPDVHMWDKDAVEIYVDLDIDPATYIVPDARDNGGNEKTKKMSWDTHGYQEFNYNPCRYIVPHLKGGQTHAIRVYYNLPAPAEGQRAGKVWLSHLLLDLTPANRWHY